jgi:Tfp pilus assembly protein PilN
VNQLNLASKPFNNKTLPWTLAIFVAFISLISVVFIVRATSQAQTRANEIQVEINELRQREQAVKQRAEEVKESLTIEQRQTLNAAHTLVNRKRFSWSRLFADLEAALPANVKVGRISVREVGTHAAQTVAELDLAVFAKSSQTVTDMIAQMDQSGIFNAELRSQTLQKGRGEAGTEYELYVIYTPRAGAPVVSDRAANIASIEPNGGDAR